jgi:hypothetical protein
MVDIDHLEKTREGEIVRENLICLCGERRRGFIDGSPFREEDGDLDEGRSIDIEVDPRFSEGRSDESDEEKKDEISPHLIELGGIEFSHTALFLRQ